MTNQPSNPPRQSWLGPRLAALVVFGIGLVAFWQALAIRESVGYSVVGPRLFPMAVAAGLVLLGAALLVRASPLRPDTALAEQAATEEASTHWPTVLIIITLLVVYLFALAPLGYSLATALFFPAAARVMGSRYWRRDLVVGILLGLTIYLVFTMFLGVRLPAGVLQGIL